MSYCVYLIKAPQFNLPHIVQWVSSVKYPGAVVEPKLSGTITSPKVTCILNLLFHMYTCHAVRALLPVVNTVCGIGMANTSTKISIPIDTLVH